MGLRWRDRGRVSDSLLRWLWCLSLRTGCSLRTGDGLRCPLNGLRWRDLLPARECCLSVLVGCSCLRTGDELRCRLSLRLGTGE
jgi:hypothetical protein